MAYIQPEIVNDETAVAESALTGIADRIEGWQPAEGDLETPITESVGVAIATAVTALKELLIEAYVGFGLRILDIALVAAGVSTCISTWTFSTEELFLIEAGTEIAAMRPDGKQVLFVVVEDVLKPEKTLVQGGVKLAAVESGAESNEATNPATFDLLVGVENVTIDAPSSGGTDAEEPEAYAGRLKDRAQRLHAIPITVTDFAVFATDVPGVARCAAVNRADPGDPGKDKPGHIELYPITSTGEPTSSEVNEAIEAYFAEVEQPFNVTRHIVAPEYENVAVAITVKAALDASEEDTKTAVEAAITKLLEKPAWDADANSPGGWVPADLRSTELTIFDICAAVDGLSQVDSVHAVTVNGGTKVTFAGPVTLPNLTGITVTVT